MQIRGSAMAGLKSACAGGAAKREEGGVRGFAPARGSLSPRDGLSVLRSFSQMDCRRAVAAFAHGKCLRECAPCKRPPCCGQWDAPIARGDRGDAGAEATQSGRSADSRNAAGAGGANRMPSRMRRTPGFGAARRKGECGGVFEKADHGRIRRRRPSRGGPGPRRRDEQREARRRRAAMEGGMRGFLKRQIMAHAAKAAIARRARAAQARRTARSQTAARRKGRGMRGRFCANGQARRQSAGYNHDC